MSTSPILSICIPTYKRPDCLAQCLDSIVEQCVEDTTIAEQVEIVISDNASNDGTEQVVETFKKQFKSIRYHKNETNIGVDKNILNVVAKAQGEYVWFLGDDDALFSGALKHILAKIKQNVFDYALVNCQGYDNTLESPAVKSPNFDITEDVVYKTVDQSVQVMDRDHIVGNFCGLSIQVFKKKLWDDFSDKEKYIGTHAIHLYILLSVMKGRSFVMIARPMVKVRAANIRWDTFPGLETVSKRTQSTFTVLQWVFDYYDIPYSKIGFYIRQKKVLLVSAIQLIVRKYIITNPAMRRIVKKFLGKL